MTGVAPYGNLMRVNGPGREQLRVAVERHRTRRGWSREDIAARGGPSAGTVKNVERTLNDVRDRTLIGLDRVFGWAEDTARSILVDKAKIPALPDRQPVAAGGVNRRLLAELEGREVYDVRAIEVSGPQGTKIILTVIGDPDTDLDAVRDAVLRLDSLERKYRGDEG